MQTHYTTPQVMTMLNIQRLTVYDNIKKGKIKATQQIINGRAVYVIQHDDLMAFIAERDSKKQNRHA